ncbi:BrnA antitoxin family protein [Granulosicoccus sp.]|nr:BrnA antitoxin family protein [Granulosicoccus sp.]
MATDFGKGKRAPVIQPDPNKTRITIRLDTDIIEHFKGIVNESGGGNYQTLINNVLRDHIEARDEGLEKKLRKIVREELKRAG